MAKPEWGTKRRCLSCGAAFYDLGKTPIICPKCDTEFHPEALLKPRRSKPEEKPVPKPAPKVIPEEADDIADSDDELVEDASELGEDGDDMAEVEVDDADPAEET